MTTDVMAPIARELGTALPQFGRLDAGMLLDRIAFLLARGETPGSILARLNLPARVEITEPLRVPPVTLHAWRSCCNTHRGTDHLVECLLATRPAEPAALPRWQDVNGIRMRIASCSKCHSEFAELPRHGPGRYPGKCLTCRPTPKETPS